MAATPPLQIRSSVRTPPAPHHGPAYDDFNSLQPRHNTRSSQRQGSRDFLSTPEAVNVTPPTGRRTATLSRQSSRSTTPGSSHVHSPQNSPKRKSSRRVQIVSPSSPALESPAPTPFTSNKPESTFVSSTTVMADGMLPTPVKTPRKKVIPGVNAAARALFQDQPILGEEVTSNSRRGRKSRRYNGFTLESFAAENEGTPGDIQIFTDSRDNVPGLDRSEDNPFVEHSAEKGEASSKKVSGTSKRRKVSGETKVDPQVQEAIRNDEGMIYVHRGKKMFVKFDDEDEEEEIDTEDLGLLDPNGDSVAARPLKALTRKSIKPTRLFQTEQKRDREAKKDEEALTDIEEQSSADAAQPVTPTTSTKDTELANPATHPATARALRSTTKKEIVDVANETASALQYNKAKTPKRSSPFDSWKRVKAGSSAVPVEPAKSKKRGSDVLDDGEVATNSKKTKAA